MNHAAAPLFEALRGFVEREQAPLYSPGHKGGRTLDPLVPGSTNGNIAVALSAPRPGEPVLVQRNAHKSVLAGLVQVGALPVWLEPHCSSSRPPARISPAWPRSIWPAGR